MKKNSGIEHWELIAHEDSEPVSFSWRCVGVDGKVIRESRRFATFGKAMVNAMDNGFNSQLHHWIKTSRRYTIYFAPDKTPVIVPAEGSALARANASPADPEKRVA